MKAAKWKQQYRDKQNFNPLLISSLSNFKYRIALPNTDSNGSQRFWNETNNNIIRSVSAKRGQIGSRTLLKQSTVKDHESKIGNDNKYHRFSEKYSFFSTVAGKSTTCFRQLPLKKTPILEMKQVTRRPLTGHSTKKHVTPYNFQTETPKQNHSQVFYHRVQSAVQRGSKWTMSKRPISGRQQTVEILNTEQFQKNKQRIDNIKNKVISQTQYSSPIQRIGYNMQNQALFKYQHLQLLVKGTEKKKYFPIQYAIRDLNIKIHHVYDSQKYYPISISLFSQFFHTNSDVSKQMRDQYLSKWMQKVGKSYDPLKIASMYKQKYLTQEQQQRYRMELNKIGQQSLSPFKPEWIENALLLIQNIQISESKMVDWVKQIWSLYEHSMRKAILDYQLLNYYERKRLNISTIPKKLSMIQKVSKYGGYSVKLFDQHAFFVNIGRCRLEAELWKYNTLSLSLQKWFHDFRSIRLVEIQGVSVLSAYGYPISFNQFVESQTLYFKQLQSILSNVWFRGSMWIFFKQMYLQSKSNNPWKTVVEDHAKDHKPLCRKIIEEHVHHKREAQLAEDNGLESDILYRQFLGKSKIGKVADYSLRLISIHTLQLDENQTKNLTINNKILSSVNQLLNLQLSQIIQNNIERLQSLFGQQSLFQLQPMIKESIMLPFTLDQSLEVVRQLFGRVMGINYMSSGVFMHKQIKPNNDYLSVFNFKQEEKIKVQWKSYAYLKQKELRALQIVEKSYIKVVEQMSPFLEFQCLLCPVLSYEKDVYLFQDFKADLKFLKDMKLKLQGLDMNYKAGVFVINTSKLHKQLLNRVEDYFELAQKRMKKELTSIILILEAEISQKNMKVLQINNTPEQLCENERFLDYYQKVWIKNITHKCKQVIRWCVAFVLEIEVDSTNKTAVFFQSKVSLLYKYMISFNKNINTARQQKQKQRNDMESVLQCKKIRIREAIEQQRDLYIQRMETFSYIPSKFKQYLEHVQSFRSYIRIINDEILHYSKNCNIIFGDDVISVQELEQELQKSKVVSQIYGSYWEFVFNIHHQIKTAFKTELINLKFQSLQTIIQMYEQEHQTIEKNFDPKDPYIKYLHNLKEEISPIEKHNRLLMQLTLPSLTIDHYNKYDPTIGTAPLRKVLDDWQYIPPREKDLKLIDLIAEVSKKQQQMGRVLNQAKQGLSREILVVAGKIQTVDFDISIDLLKKIQQKQYLMGQIEGLRQVSTKFRQFKELISHLKTSILEILELKVVHKKFQFRYIGLHRLFRCKYRHLIFEAEKFKIIESIWKQIIQIIKKKPIISQLSSNKYLNSQIYKGNQLTIDVESQLMLSIDNLYGECDALLMATKKEIKKYLTQGGVQQLISKCFPTLGEIEIEADSIVSVGGQKNRMMLVHPIEIDELYPEKWMKDLQESISFSLLYLVKKNLCSEILDNLPNQVISIILMIRYTKLIEQNLGSAQKLQDIFFQVQHLRNTLGAQTIKSRLPQIIRDKQKWEQFPKYYLNQGITLKYKDVTLEFGGVFYGKEGSLVESCSWQQKAGYLLGRNLVEVEQEEMAKNVVAICRKRKIIVIGNYQNKELQKIKVQNCQVQKIFFMQS